MYFDPFPKTSRNDLFGRDYLLDSLAAYLRDEQVRLIVLKGLRRTGKTSVLNVALQEAPAPTVKIDVREAPYYDRREFFHYVIEQVKAAVGESLFQKILKSISKIQLSYQDLAATFYLEIESKFLTFLRDLNQELAKKKQYVIIAFDEVQLLSKIKFDVILAAVYDNYPRLKLLVTGSEIGVMDEFLGKQDADSSLFGRALLELEVQKFNHEQLTQFLQQGFKQIGRSISLQEMKDVLENFDGIIGWATQYGFWRSKKYTHQQAIVQVVEEGTKLTQKELDRFLEKRNRAVYTKILRWIPRGYNRWNLLKNQFMKEGTAISDRQLHLFLQELLDYSFIEKRNEDYLVPDPLVLRALG